jgi:hypothetical protein
MKIEWLNEERSEVAITRGLWRKRRALLSLKPNPISYDPDRKTWFYSASGKPAESDIADLVVEADKRERIRRQHELDWQPVMSLRQAIPKMSARRRSRT